MKFKKFICGAFLAGTSWMLSAAPAHAVPSLQIDVLGGTYNDAEKTIIASDPVFRMFAIVKEDSVSFDPVTGLSVNPFYISAAVLPSAGPDPVDLGSFNFGGIDVAATGDMTYGTPIDGDLPSHGIFPTYFKEFEFYISDANTAAEYNVEENAGDGPLVHPGTGLYYAEILVNVTNFSVDAAMHFDLYTKTTQTKRGVTTVVLDQMAPPSHDAQSGPGGGGEVPPPDDENSPGVPEPMTTALGAMSLAALTLATRRRRVRG